VIPKKSAGEKSEPLAAEYAQAAEEFTERDCEAALAIIEAGCGD
jgi:hypothetical protein